ncbi:LamG-like jellyroll fold domain-containing protein [Pseudanabaena sp. PCC 6802]|uniref:LamG-like jellyroll fold domain-containing protein n=1 Tax=Pseudanabaena sp. PCC 6802 TaxID=118173 RepID=UPI0003633DF3|nr:LamG-like jellyroll fold domain-containing protein [Pseudanabaena sp. PCC 6802]
MPTPKALSPIQTLEMFKESHPDLNSIEKILDFSEEIFVKDFTDREPFNGDIRKARQAYRAAQRIQEQITLLWANLKDIGSPVLKEALFNNIPQSFIDYFNSIPAYNRLFGNLDFIETDHSRSIFGPAAYFVDLLRFIEKNIIKNDKNSIPAGHELEKRHLRLFRLPLDKENTFNLVPYIDLVTEALEDIVRRPDEPEKSPYQVLEEAKFPMQLPFHLPLEEIRLYLKQLKISLEEIYRLFSLVGQEAFTDLLPDEDESGEKLTSDRSKILFEELQKKGILDFRGALTDAFQPDDPNFNLILSSDFIEYEKHIVEKLQEYRGLEVAIAREILALSPREYQLIENPVIAESELGKFYGTTRKLSWHVDTTFVDSLNRQVFPDSLRQKFITEKQILSESQYISVFALIQGEKWRISDLQKKKIYIIQKEGARLTISLDVVLEGKGSLEDVEVFIEKTGLTHKQLDALLFLDHSNDEINAGLPRLLFINNTGDVEGYLSITSQFDKNKLFDLDFSADTNADFTDCIELLGQHIFPKMLHKKFVDWGIDLTKSDFEIPDNATDEEKKRLNRLNASASIEVLIDVLVAARSGKWLIKDANDNKLYILQVLEKSLKLYEGKEQKLTIEGDKATALLALLNKPKLSNADLIAVGVELRKNLSLSDKLEINEWKTDKWRVRDSEKNKTYIICHDFNQPSLNQLSVFDEPYDRLENLTLKRLDRIYRFLKLSRKLDWTFADLDWALRTLQKTPVGEKVLRFDGVNDYIAIPNVRDPKDPDAFKDTFTLEAWVQPTQAKINPIFAKGTPDGSFTQFLFYVTPKGKLAFFCNANVSTTQGWGAKLKAENNNQNIFQIKDGELVAINLKNIPTNDRDNKDYGLTLMSDRSIPLDVFTHVAATVNEEKKIDGKNYYQLKFYINGILDSTWSLDNKLPVTDLPDVSEPEKVQIDINIGKNLLNEFLSGSITDICLWNHILSEEDIQTNRFKRLNGREEKLFAYWPLIESLDSQIKDYAVIKDEKKQLYHGILGNDSPHTLPIWVHGDLALDAFPTPLSIYAYHFNGVDEYVGGKVKNLDLNALTIEAWVTIDEAKTYPILLKADVVNKQVQPKYKLWINDDNKLVFWDGWLGQTFTADRAIERSQPQHINWVHIAVAKGAAVELFLNGEAVTATHAPLTSVQVEPSTTLELEDTSILYLGRDFTPNYLKGSLQEVRIWNLNQTQKAIDANRHHQLTGNEPGLVGYWRLDEPNPHLSEARDRTVNKNHLFPGGILELYQPQPKTYNDPILPDPVQSESEILTFGANQYPAIIQNDKREGLGHFEQFTLQFCFKADEPGVGDRKQVLYTQGDKFTGLNIYLSQGRLFTYAWHEDFDGTPIDEPVSLEHSPIEAGKWYHLTFTYDETVEDELFKCSEEDLKEFLKISETNPIQGTDDPKFKNLKQVLAGQLSFTATPNSIKVWIDEPNNQWRIRDYLSGKTFLIRRQDDRLTIYEKTPHPQDEVAYRLYLDGKEKDFKENGFRLDQVGTTYLGSLTPNIFTRFEDGLAPADTDCHFAGQITEFRIWQRVLSDRTIHRLQHIPPELKDKDLICYLPMTEGFGRIVSDHAGPLYENQGLELIIPDQSPNCHDGKLSVGSDTPRWVEVKDLPIFRDRVLKLNGKEQYLLLPYASDLNLIDCDFTLETWIRVEAFATQDMPIVGSDSPKDADDDVAKNQGFYLLLTDRGHIRAGLYGDHVTSEKAIDPKCWHHIAWRFEKAAKTQTLFIDGQPQGTLSDSQSLQNDIPLYLGYRQVKQGYQPPAQSYFTGEVAELKVWSAAREDTQIQETWNQELKGNEDNLEAYWIFDRDPRSLLVDRTNSSHRAPIELGSNSDLETKWNGSTTPFRRQSLALQLNPEADRPIDYIDLAPCVIPDRGTIELWVQFCRTEEQILLDASTADRQHHKHFFIAVSHQTLYFHVTDDSGIETVAHIHLTGFPEAFDSAWHHLVATWEFNPQTAETSIQLILDSFYKDRSRRKGNGKKPEFPSPFLGLKRTIERIDYPTQIPHAQSFQGKISQLRVWDRVLTRQELQRFQNADLEGNEKGLSFCLVVVEEPVASKKLLLYAPKTDRSDVEPLSTHLKDLVSGKIFCLSRLAIPDPHPHWVDIDTGIKLDGEDDFIHLEHYCPTESGTIEVWAKFAPARNQFILDASNDEPQGIPEQQKFFLLEVRDRQLRFGIEDDSDLNCVVHINLDREAHSNFFSQWHHIVVAWQFDKVNQKIKAWLALDGEIVETCKPNSSKNWIHDYIPEWQKPKAHGIEPTFKTLFLGKQRGSYYPWKDCDLPRSFEGEIAQIRIWNCVRSYEDLQNLRDVPLQGTEPGLLVYLPIEEGEGTTLNNLVPNGEHALLFIGGNCDADEKWVTLDRGVQLNGIDEFIELPKYVPSEQGTIEVWGQFSRFWDRVIFDASGDADNCFLLEVNDGSLCYKLLQEPIRFDLTSFPETFDRGWHHIAVTWHSDVEHKKIVTKLYVDGRGPVESDLCLPDKTLQQVLKNLYVGIQRDRDFATKRDRAFIGTVSQIRIWDRALCSEELHRWRYAKLEGSETGLLFNLPIDEGTETKLRDLANGGSAFLKTGGSPLPQWHWQSPQLFHFQQDYVVLPKTEVLGINNSDFTLETWIKLEDLSEVQPILGIRGPRDPQLLAQEQLVLSVNLEGHVLVQMHGKQLAADRIKLFPHRWYHVVCQYQASERKLSLSVLKRDRAHCQYDRCSNHFIATIYTSGSEYSHQLAEHVELYNAHRRLYIGFWRSWNVKTKTWDDNFFRGFIDEVRIWEGTRTRDQIKQDRDRRLRGDEAGLFAYWTLKEDRHRTLYALGSQHHQARIPDRVPQIAALYDLASEQPPIYAPRPAAKLDGYNDYIALGQTFLSNGRTIEFWFKTQQWHHLAAVYEESAIPTLFYDGAAIPDPLPQDFDPKLYEFLLNLNRSTPPDKSSQFFSGQIAELRLWDCPRTPAEIQANFKRRLTGREAHLWAYWPLNEGEETCLYDESEILAPAEWVVGLENTADKWQPLPPPDIREPISIAGLKTSPLSALYLDGKDDFITLGDIADLKLNHDFTVEAWVKIDESAEGKTMAVLGSKALSNIDRSKSILCLGIKAKRPYFSFGGKNSLHPNWNLDQGWHHLTWQYEARSKTMRILVDGIQIAKKNEQPAFTGRGEARIGYCQEWDESSLKDRYFAGGLGEIRIWHSFRSEEEIRAYYKRRLPGEGDILQKLVAYWIFDDRNHTIVPSRVKVEENSYQLVTHSDKDRGQPNWNCIQDRPILLNPLLQKALHFDGKQQYLATDEFQLPSAAFTLEAWVKVEDLDEPRPIFWWSSRERKFEVRISQEGKVQFLNANGETLVETEDAAKITPASFNNIAVTVQPQDGEEVITLWINGKDEGSDCVPVPTPLDNPQDSLFQVGRGNPDGSSTYFKGSIQEIRIWNRAKTGLELQQHLYYPLQLQPILSDLLAYWPLAKLQENSSGLYAPNLVKDKPALLRLGGLLETRKPDAGEPMQFLDARRPVLTLPISKGTLHQLPILSFKQQHHPDRSQRTVEVWFVCDNPFLADKQLVYEEKRKDPRLESVSFRAFTLAFRHQNVNVLSYLILYQFLIYRHLSIYVQSGQVHFEIFNQLEPEDKCPDRLDDWFVSTIKTDRIQAGRWHHVALVLDGRDEICDNAIYALLDGRVIDTQPAFQLWGTPEYAIVGGLEFALSSNDASLSIHGIANPLIGQIKEVRVWEAARSPKAIKNSLDEQLQNNQFKLFDKDKPEQILFRWETHNLPKGFVSGMRLLAATEPSISDPQIPLMDLAHLLQLKNEYQQSVDRLCSLWAEVKHIGIADRRTLFDDIFNSGGTSRPLHKFNPDRLNPGGTSRPVDKLNLNLEKIGFSDSSFLKMSSADQYWSYGQRIRWEVNSTETSQRQIRTRLMSALRVSSPDLVLMVQAISGEVDTVILDGSYLSQLYRLKLLATLLKLSIEDAIKLRNLLKQEYKDTTPLNDLAHFTIQDAIKLKTRADWMRETEIDLSEYDYLVNDKEDKRVSVPYKDTDVFDMAVALLNQCREHLLSPQGLVTEGISESASEKIYQQLKDDGNIQEITLQLPSGNNNTDTVVNLGVIQPGFAPGALSPDNYLELIAQYSNWLAAFEGAIDLTIARRKAYILFKTSLEVAISSDEFLKKIQNEFQKKGFVLSSSKLITREWLIKDKENNNYLIENNDDGLFSIKPIDNADILSFAVDTAFEKSLNQQIIPEDLRTLLVSKNISLSPDASVTTTEWLLEWSIKDQSNKNQKKAYLIILITGEEKQLQVIQTDSIGDNKKFTLDSKFIDKFISELNNTNVSPDLQIEFLRNEIKLPQQIEIITKEWQIEDKANGKTYAIKHEPKHKFSIYLIDSTDKILGIDLAFDEQLNEQRVSNDLCAFFSQKKAPLALPITVKIQEWELSEVFDEDKQKTQRSYTVCLNPEQNPNKPKEINLDIYGGWIDDLGRVILEEVLLPNLPNIEGSFTSKLELLPLNYVSTEQTEFLETVEKLRGYFLKENYFLSQDLVIQKRWEVEDGSRIYSIQQTQDNLLNVYQSDRFGKSLLFTVPPSLSLIEKLNQETVPIELFEQKGYTLSPKPTLEKEWLIIDRIQQTSYLIRHNTRENQLDVLDIQDPEQLSLKKLQNAYKSVTPKPSNEKLLEVKAKLLKQQKLQSSLVPYITAKLIALRDGLLGTLLTPLADLLGTNPDRLKLIIESTKDNSIEGNTYGKGQLFAEKYLQEINKVAIAQDKDKALLQSSALRDDLKQWSKILFLLSQFALSDFEIAVLLKQPKVFGLEALDLLKPSQSDLTDLYTFVKLKTELRDPTDPSDRSNKLVRILQKEEGLTISSLTNWTDAEINTLCESLKIEAGSLAMLDLDRLSQGFRLIRKLGTNAQYLVDLATETSDLKAFDPIKSADPRYEFYQRHAEVLFNLMRARYNAEQWPLVYKPLHDLLAVQKRDGLTAFVMEELSDKIQNRKSPDLLYEYLLIDVQTGSEVDTSRIVQGIASLQLYVQRCLMDLEAGVKPETIPPKEWEWMKNYRVWEANRKVFLYPENYIEPELRDTKTPEFEALEEELLQDEITQDTVERAIIHYLDKVKELVDLKIVGAYLHKEIGAQGKQKIVLYLIGRTNSHPGIYYYREYIVSKDRWLSWEKIDLAINSDFVSPVYAFNKLFIFWVELTITKKDADENGKKVSRDFYKPTVKYSYYNFDKTWTVPKIYLELPADFQVNANQEPDPNLQRVFVQNIKEFAPPKDSRQLIPVNDNFSNVKVAIISKSADLARFIPNFSMDKLTWSFWVKISNVFAIPPGEVSLSDLPQKTLMLFSYGDPQSNENTETKVKATFANQFIPIPEIVDLKRRLEDIQIEVANAQNEFDTQQVEVTNAQNEFDTQQVEVTNAQNEFDIKQTELTNIQLQINEAQILVTNARILLENASNEDARDAARQELQTAQSNLNQIRLQLDPAQQALNQALDVLQTARNELNQARQTLQTARNELNRARQTLQTARNNLNQAQNNWEEALKRPHWQEQLVFAFHIGDQKFETTKLSFNTWQYVAIIAKHDGSAYDVNLLVFKQDAQPITPSTTPDINESKRLTVSIISPAKKLSIGQIDPVNVEQAFTAQMSEFQLRGIAGNPGEIANNRYNREENAISQGLRLALDGREGKVTVESSTLQLKVISANIIPVEPRERILILYRDQKKILRDSLDDELHFSLNLSLKQSVPETYDYDLILNESRLSITYADSLLNYGEYLAADASFQKLVTLIFRNSNLIQGIAQYYTLKAFWDRNILLDNLKIKEVSLLDVNNQPGWYILDTGDEQFLIRIAIDVEKLKTTEERMTLEYGSRTANQPQPISLFLEHDTVLSVEKPQDNQSPRSPSFKYQFDRLNTFAIHELSKRLFQGGIDSFLSLDSQEIKRLELEFSNYKPVPGFDFATPPSITLPTIDFKGANHLYFEEIFFHIPFLIANQLNTDQRFAEAQKWYHYIFNPTAQEDSSSANTKDRYWHYRPFRNQNLETFSEMLSNDKALTEYREDPFDPHTIANLRLNTYQKAVVMKYIDNLLDWGDYLFRQDTRESINEAIPLYVLAFNLLGPRPKAKPERKLDPMGTYQDIQADLQQNNISELPDFLIPSGDRHLNDKVEIPFDPNRSVIARFSVPENAQLMGYWDRVEGRLYNIRHSLNIDGVFRALDLFQPPIDPAALVRAVAGGGLAGGISAALASLNMPVPHYRYSFMLEKAKEMNRQAIELGSALLQALEKKDAEELLLLQHTHELNIMNRMTEVKQLQIQETETNLESLKASLENAQDRKQHYEALMSKGISSLELAQISLIQNALDARKRAGNFKKEASLIGLLPDFSGGISGGFPTAAHVTASIGGTQASRFHELEGTRSELTADEKNTESQTTGLMANYERREQDWQLQKTIAEHDIAQIEQQIAATEIQIKIASRELQIHELTISQHKEVGNFYRNKFTNKELYSWMTSRLSGLYFQTYKLAFDLAKKAEKAYQYEYGTNDTYIDFGHWDSRRKGLLAGEGLRLDLARLEKAALDQHCRYLEVTKHISLLRLDPNAFLQLKATGRCQFGLGELLFDRDFPGHYFRTIKSVTISIPAVIGPYQTFRATLTQTSNKTLLAPDITGVQYLMGDGDQSPTTIRADFRANQQIAISTGVEDSGMFELNFGDGRYLPFEGTGAISTWLLEMPKATNPIDFSTISDVIIHVRYTAKADGGLFKQNVMGLEAFKTYEGVRLINVAQELATDWHVFKNSETKTDFNIPLGTIAPPNVKVSPDNITMQYIRSAGLDGSLTDVTSQFSQESNEQILTIKGKGDGNFDKKNLENLFVFLSFTGSLV